MSDETAALDISEQGQRYVLALRWAQAVSDIAYSVFLVAAVAYVILWLRRRDGGNG